MIKKMSWALLPLIAVFALNGSASGKSRYDDSKESVYRAGYDRGYSDGLRRGDQDYRAGGRYGNNRDREYRDDSGYINSMGHKGDYKKGYREGYQAGYNNGLRGRGNGRSAGNRRFPGNYPQRNPGNYPGNYPGRYPDTGRYPDSYPGGGYPGGGYPGGGIPGSTPAGRSVP